MVLVEMMEEVVVYGCGRPMGNAVGGSWARSAKNGALPRIQAPTQRPALLLLGRTCTDSRVNVILRNMKPVAEQLEGLKKCKDELARIDARKAELHVAFFVELIHKILPTHCRCSFQHT